MAASLPSPSPLYTPAQLAQLMEISSVIKCECPNHLAQIVSSVIAFEDYARECESENAQDAQMHLRLHQAALEARAVLEAALADLVAFEQIELR